MKFLKLARIALCAAVLVFASTAVIAKKQSKAENEYPNATRSDVKPTMSERDQRYLNKATDLVNDGKGAEAEPLIQKVFDNKRSSDYAKAFAHQLQAQVYWDADKGDQSIAEYKAAIALDALPNSAQFQVIYALAQTQLQEEKYQEAIATLEEWEKLTGKQTGDELALKANAYYRTDQYQLAVDTMKRALATDDEPKESWNQILMASLFELDQYDEAANILKAQLAKSPKDVKLINQLAKVYINADKYPQAIEVLSKAKAQGLINSADDYVQLAKLYANADQPKEAAATLKEGMEKGIVESNYENTKLLGDVCNQADDEACAIDAYQRASAQSKDGNADYQLGYMLFYADRGPEAKVALDRAIQKGGLRQEGEAYILLGDVESYADNNAAALAAWRKAEGFPSTKTMAAQRIKVISSGVKLKRTSKKK
ncbi:MAG TPA: tetratricopeptide repeat protein [Dokdonella sp.]|uniref:tetratricopeptide repeat protein n=1 Tax=Dokdonella sp. TaxID=2291710 RepID=UPI002D80E50B|nr:tetratricopeptide repeat protein [Dokdonella sp.]HET9034519.1 tetratricopeptide repeat protein [Dokdonella sp.]